jgi:hypothetical protein
MAKKARRKKQAVLTQAQLAGTRQQGQVSADKVAIKVENHESVAKGQVDFAKQYHYVITDLQRIGVLAAIMLAVLFALNFLLK